MLVKFFQTGTRKTKSGESARDYLLNERVEEGTARLLRGNVNLTTAIINDISHFSKTYTSGCLSFNSGVFISQQQIDDVIDSFEQTLLPSLDRDQYQSYWVEHVDKGKLELNFVIANVELLNGTSLTPYYGPAQKNTVNTWKLLTNLALGLEDPEDPLYRRNFLRQQIHDKKIKKDSKQTDGSVDVFDLKTLLIKDKNKKDMVEIIAQHIEDRVNKQLIHNRNDVIDFLRQQKIEITEIDDKHLRIKNPDTSLYRGKPRRPIKLAGYYFEKDFDASQSTPNAKEKLSIEWRYEQYKNLRKLQEFYRQSLLKRAARLQKRYKREDPNTDFEPMLPPEPMFGPPPAPVVYDDPTDQHDLWVDNSHFVLKADEINDKLVACFDQDSKTVVKIRTTYVSFAQSLESKAAQYDLALKVAITNSLDAAVLDYEFGESENRINTIKAMLHPEPHATLDNKEIVEEHQVQTVPPTASQYRTAKDLFRIKINVLSKEAFEHTQKTGEGNNVVSLDFAHQLVTNNDALEMYDIYYFTNLNEPNTVRPRSLLNNNHAMQYKIWKVYQRALQGFGRVKVDQFIDDYCNLPVEDFCKQYQIPWREQEVELFDRSHPALGDVIPGALTVSTAELLNLRFPIKVYKRRRFDNHLELDPDQYVDVVSRLSNDNNSSFDISYQDQIEEMEKKIRELLTKLLRMLAEFIFGNRHNTQMMQDTQALNIVDFIDRYPLVSVSAGDINQQFESLTKQTSHESIETAKPQSTDDSAWLANINRPKGP